MTINNFSKIFKTSIFLLCALPSAVFSQEDFATRLEVEERSELAAMNLVPQDGAVQLRISNPADNSGIEVNFRNGETSFSLFPKRFFPKEFTRDISARPAPAADSLCWFTFKRTERAWTAFINDHEILRMPELWKGPMVIRHADKFMPSDDEIDDYTQKLGAFTFEDNFLVPAGSAFPPSGSCTP